MQNYDESQQQAVALVFRRVNSNLWRACDELSDAERSSLEALPQLLEPSRHRLHYHCIPYLEHYAFYGEPSSTSTASSSSLSAAAAAAATHHTNIRPFKANVRLLQLHLSACAFGIIVCILYTTAVIIALTSIVIKHYCVLFLTNAIIYWLCSLYTVFCLIFYYYKMEHQRKLGMLPLLFEQPDWHYLEFLGIDLDSVRHLKHFRLNSSTMGAVGMSAVVAVFAGLSWWRLSVRMKYVMILQSWYLKEPLPADNSNNKQ